MHFREIVIFIFSIKKVVGHTMKQNATYYRALANSRYDYLEAVIETVNAYALFSISNVRRNLVRQLSYYLLHELQV